MFYQVSADAAPLQVRIHEQGIQLGSLFMSSLEHALYGCWLFPVGLGQYFYHGRIALG